uniref:ATP synthase complex subunit 8 n=1 Tax=Macromia manchurica TaxID=1389456 RepID=A0A8F9RT39_9ODON|nr:ATP synthase F0 subunit 8 [Macromia manchurica]
MPQMAPMSWSLLFIFFTLMLMIIATLNFFLYMPKTSKGLSESSVSSSSKNWKW